MKKFFNTTVKACVALLTLSNTNVISASAAASEIPSSVLDDRALVAGCKTVTEAQRTFNCPLEIPGAYTINPDRIDVFLAACGPVAEFITAQEAAFAAKAKAVNPQELKLFQIAQIIAQSYFRGTGEKDYIHAIPVVIGHEAEILHAAQGTGLLTLHAPLERYRQYEHLAAAIGGSRTLVLGCGRASLNTPMFGLYTSALYELIEHTGFVSSGCYCDHGAHVTVSRSPGIFPTIVADILDPAFQAGLAAAAKAIGGFEKIIDEDGIVVSLLYGVEKAEGSKQLDFFKSLLKPGGRFIGNAGYIKGDSANPWKVF